MKINISDWQNKITAPNNAYNLWLNSSRRSHFQDSLLNCPSDKTESAAPTQADSHADPRSASNICYRKFWSADSAANTATNHIQDRYH